ncbi:unnamed protein product, partial [Rotaria socialis]
AYPISAQPQHSVRYITTNSPHGLSATGQPTGTYTIGIKYRYGRLFYVYTYRLNLIE